KKPYLLALDSDFATFDVAHTLRRLMLYGLIPSPNYDYGTAKDYWDTPYVDRDRPLFRKFMPLFRLESKAGWEPQARALSSDPAVHLERWGRKGGGPLLFSAWNSSAAASSATVTIDLAALGIQPADVGRVVDLVEAGVVPARVNGTALE